MTKFSGSTKNSEYLSPWSIMGILGMVILLLSFMLSIRGCIYSAAAQTRPTTVLWEQPNTIPALSYALMLDGNRTALNATCLGTTYPKQCSAPLPASIDMTRVHELAVVAIGEWGEASSTPLRFGPPTAPQAVVVR